MANLTLIGMDQNGQERIAQSTDVLVLPNINTSGRAVQTTTFTSGTGKQMSTTADVDTCIPITYNPTTIAQATCVLAISADGVTYATLTTETVPIGVAFVGSIQNMWPHIPAGYYVKLTTTNATIGTVSYW